MEYTENAIEELYQENLNKAQNQLAYLLVAEGRVPNIKGLNGWIYEQTIRYCITHELRLMGLDPNIDEQVSLFGRAKIDLVIGKAAIEIKALGSFGNDTKKYIEYRAKVEEKGWRYFYFTRSETYGPYRSQTSSIFGEEYTFFMDKSGEWKRFVDKVKVTL